jgi:hypothetical protein
MNYYTYATTLEADTLAENKAEQASGINPMILKNAWLGRL